MTVEPRAMVNEQATEAKNNLFSESQKTFTGRVTGERAVQVDLP